MFFLLIFFELKQLELVTLLYYANICTTALALVIWNIVLNKIQALVETWI